MSIMPDNKPVGPLFAVLSCPHVLEEGAEPIVEALRYGYDEESGKFDDELLPEALCQACHDIRNSRSDWSFYNVSSVELDAKTNGRFSQLYAEAEAMLDEDTVGFHEGLQ